MIEYEGRLTVYRGYGLTAHLLELKVGKSCEIPFSEYSLDVIYATLSRMKRVKGLHFDTKIIRELKKPASKIKVTRIK